MQVPIGLVVMGAAAHVVIHYMEECRGIAEEEEFGGWLGRIAKSEAVRRVGKAGQFRVKRIVTRVAAGGGPAFAMKVGATIANRNGCSLPQFIINVKVRVDRKSVV